MCHSLQQSKTLLIKFKLTIIQVQHNKNNNFHNINKFKNNHKFIKKKKMTPQYKEILIIPDVLRNLQIYKKAVKMIIPKNLHPLINLQLLKNQKIYVKKKLSNLKLVLIKDKRKFNYLKIILKNCSKQTLKIKKQQKILKC